MGYSDLEQIIDKSPKVLLGDLIELVTETNQNKQYGLSDAKGMTLTKEVIPTKANLKESDLTKFIVVRPKCLIYNPRTHGKKIGFGINNTDKPFIISWNNIAFKVQDENVLDAEYLYINFTRDEWDREACFRSWGSSTEVFSWNELCLMKISLPSIEVQREYIATYNGLRNLAEQNEAIIKPLQNACNAYLVKLKEKYETVELGHYIEEVNQRNETKKYGIEHVRGVSVDKKLIFTKANMDNVSLKPYKKVEPNWFVYVTVTSRNGDKISISENDSNEIYIVSSSYIVFKTIDDMILIADYLNLFFRRPEFDRLARFNSWGSARETFDYSELCRVIIPLPPIEVQQSIVNIYRCAEEARSIAEEARNILKTACPAMIQRAARTISN